MDSQSRTLSLSFPKGITITIHSAFDSVISNLTHDFVSFLSAEPVASPSLKVEILNLALLPEKRIGFRVFRSSTRWSRNGEQCVRFFGKAELKYHFNRGYAKVVATEPDLAYEMVYSLILSYVGERLDLVGWHRIHGLGVDINGKGALVLAPSGGGKSSLGFEFLKIPNAKWLSDDVPLVSCKSEMLAWPLRFSFREKPADRSLKLRRFRRERYPEKFVLSAEQFQGKIRQFSKVDYLVRYRKLSHGSAKIKRLYPRNMVWPLFKWLVIGYETPQIAELFLRPSFSDMTQKTKILKGRLATMRHLLTHAKLLEVSAPTPRAGAEALASVLS